MMRFKSTHITHYVRDTTRLRRLSSTSAHHTRNVATPAVFILRLRGVN